MGIKLKSINWKNSRLPPKINGNLLFVSQGIKDTQWNILKFEPQTYKLIIYTDNCQMSIYLSTLTIQTSLNHPKQGKTQLTRKNVTIKEFHQLLKDPRAHTNKGYHFKAK